MHRQPDVALLLNRYYLIQVGETKAGFGQGTAKRPGRGIGERMGMLGAREISAVCTHPDFGGRGLACRLLAFLSNELLARGELPFFASQSDQRAGSAALRSERLARPQRATFLALRASSS